MNLLTIFESTHTQYKKCNSHSDTFQMHLVFIAKQFENGYLLFIEFMIESAENRLIQNYKEKKMCQVIKSIGSCYCPHFNHSGDMISALKSSVPVNVLPQ